MSDLIIHGARPLAGRIEPSANKNAVLPVLAATLLTDQPLALAGVPDITDVRKLLAFFRELGSHASFDAAAGVLELQHAAPAFDVRVHRLPAAMRASTLLVPALLARFGAARIEPDVQGCTLGAREIDPHLEVFQRFGARIERDGEAWVVQARRPLQGADHWPDHASVTATENFVLCATTARGTSTLTNAACEPHVQEFCRFMQRMGARIDGIGTSRLTVHGVDALRGAAWRFAEDFHEVATFLALGAITGGDVQVRNTAPELWPLLDRTFAKFGVFTLHEHGWSRAVVEGRLRVREPLTRHLLQKVEAAPWPYVPADLLPIFIALGVRAEGQTLFWNKVYDGALGWVSELAKFGAQAFQSDPHRVVTFGGRPLQPASVTSPYIIRVAIALLMVAAGIEGRSTIRSADPIRRAHPRFAENLALLGANVAWREVA
ncbi:MAG: UDP-N-acetylglucosamine 1-carboxyvinyltransferase [Burkholderiaceae bacterium]